MSLWSFIKSKALLLFANLLLTAFIVMLLSSLNVSSYTIFYICGAFVLIQTAVFILEFIVKKSYYSKLYKILESLDKKYLFFEIIDEPDFLDGKILFDVVSMAEKSMNDEIAKYRLMSEEYREYIEMWIHEVKTPIASSKLIIENNLSEVTKSIGEELDKIDGYIEQALFYSRSNNVEKDYIIKEISLKSAVNSVIRKNSKYFINEKIGLKTEGLEKNVFTDPKWLDFILNQILINAIKYKKENPLIEIRAEEQENSTVLFICDNGIGISEKDVFRVFEKGNTGLNGRKYAKSTGLGLYLCKKLCLKLGLNISLSSKEGEGTTVKIIFPHSSMYQ